MTRARAAALRALPGVLNTTVVVAAGMNRDELAAHAITTIDRCHDFTAKLIDKSQSNEES